MMLIMLAAEAPQGVDLEAWGPLLTIAGIVISAIASAWAALYAARATRQTNQQTNQLTGWEKQVEQWRTDTDTLRRQRTEDEKRHREEREADSQRFHTEVARCHERIDELQAAAARERKAFATWARKVVEIMRERQVEFPPPPAGILGEDE